MPSYRKRIFVRAIMTRMEAEQVDRETIFLDYPRLTEVEKEILRKEIPERLGE